MLIVCSVFDKVKKKSVFITMSENVDDAIREFTRSMSHPSLKDFKNDLVLYHIGAFDVGSLVLTSCDKTVLKEGALVETID